MEREITKPDARSNCGNDQQVGTMSPCPDQSPGFIPADAANRHAQASSAFKLIKVETYKVAAPRRVDGKHVVPDRGISRLRGTLYGLLIGGGLIGCDSHEAPADGRRICSPGEIRLTRTGDPTLIAVTAWRDGIEVIPKTGGVSGFTIFRGLPLQPLEIADPDRVPAPSEHISIEVQFDDPENAAVKICGTITEAMAIAAASGIR